MTAWSQLRLLVPADKFKACYAFYKDVMGFMPSDDGDSVYTAFAVPGTTIEIALFYRSLMAEAAKASAKPETAEVQDAAVVCFEVDDVDARFAKMQAQGAQVAAEPHDQPDWLLRVALLRDPAGNLIEINQGLKR